MRTTRLVPAFALGLAVLAGCSGTSSEPEGPDPSATAEDACTEVVAGIDAFNLGDYVETVDHFRKAVPLAEAQARSDGSKKASDLVEAVKYYADLDPEGYPEAARSSPDFAKYKAITLGQCVPVGEPSSGSTEPPPVTT